MKEIEKLLEELLNFHVNLVQAGTDAEMVDKVKSEILSLFAKLEAENKDWAELLLDAAKQIASLTEQVEQGKKYKAFWDNAREIEKMNFETYDWQGGRG